MLALLHDCGGILVVFCMYLFCTCNDCLIEAQENIITSHYRTVDHRVTSSLKAHCQATISSQHTSTFSTPSSVLDTADVMDTYELSILP